MHKLAPQYILNRTPYVAAKALIPNPNIKHWVDLSSNENCLGLSKMALMAAKESLHLSHLYPNKFRHELIKALTDFYKDYGVKEENIALGSGSSELIINLVRGLVFRNESVLTSWPTFITFRQAIEVHGVEEIAVPLDKNLDYDLLAMLKKVHEDKESKIKIVFILNPNNPTGSYIKTDDLKDFIKELPKDLVLVLDEAYREYVNKKDYESFIETAIKRPKTMVLRTFSKIYGMAGLRLGVGIGDPNIVDVLIKVLDHYNLNSVVQYAAHEAIKDQMHVKKSQEHNEIMLSILSKGLEDLGFLVKKSVCNFVLAKIPNNFESGQFLTQELFKKGIIIRAMDSYGLKDYVRISVGTKEDIGLLFKELYEINSGY